MLLCHCAVVNDATIRNAIDLGARDADEVGDLCEAGTYCGGCLPEIERMCVEARLCAPQPLLRRATPAMAGAGAEVA
jgi:bacterioferritin-associated ferredoxin